MKRLPSPWYTLAFRTNPTNFGINCANTSHVPRWLRTSTTGTPARNSRAIDSIFSTSTRSRIFSGAIWVSFALQSRLAPSRWKWQRTSSRNSRGDFSFANAISRLRVARRRYFPETTHAPSPSHCPKAKRNGNGSTATRAEPAR